MGGLDALVFTGGVGERSAVVRGRAADGLEFLGVAVDAGANEAAVPDAEIGGPSAPPRTLVGAARPGLQIAPLPRHPPPPPPRPRAGAALTAAGSRAWPGPTSISPRWWNASRRPAASPPRRRPPTTWPSLPTRQRSRPGCSGVSEGSRRRG